MSVNRKELKHDFKKKPIHLKGLQDFRHHKGTSVSRKKYCFISYFVSLEKINITTFTQNVFMNVTNCVCGFHFETFGVGIVKSLY